MFRRSWVQIPATYTGWTFSHMFVVKIVMFQKTKIKEKEAGDGLFKKTFEMKTGRMHQPIIIFRRSVPDSSIGT